MKKKGQWLVNLASTRVYNSKRTSLAIGAIFFKLFSELKLNFSVLKGAQTTEDVGVSLRLNLKSGLEGLGSRLDHKTDA